MTFRCKTSTNEIYKHAIHKTYLFESLLGHADANIHQIPNDLIDVLPVETHFRKLRRLHLDERRLRKLRYASRNLSLRKISFN